jgi:hypothetical protein
MTSDVPIVDAFDDILKNNFFEDFFEKRQLHHLVDFC